MFSFAQLFILIHHFLLHFTCDDWMSNRTALKYALELPLNYCSFTPCSDIFFDCHILGKETHFQFIVRISKSSRHRNDWLGIALTLKMSIKSRTDVIIAIKHWLLIENFGLSWETEITNGEKSQRKSTEIDYFTLWRQRWKPLRKAASCCQANGMKTAIRMPFASSIALFRGLKTLEPDVESVVSRLNKDLAKSASPEFETHLRRWRTAEKNGFFSNRDAAGVGT